MLTSEQKYYEMLERLSAESLEQASQLNLEQLLNQYHDLSMNFDRLLVEKVNFKTFYGLTNGHNNQLHQMLKNLMIADAGLVDYPTVEKIWDYAWEQSHSGGYREVLDTLHDLVDLLPH